MNQTFHSLPIHNDAALAALLLEKKHEAFTYCVPVGSLYPDLDAYQAACDMTDREDGIAEGSDLPRVAIIRHDSGFLCFSEFIPSATDLAKTDDEYPDFLKVRSMSVAFIDYRMATTDMDGSTFHAQHRHANLMTQAIAKAGLDNVLISDPGLAWDTAFVEIQGTADAIDPAPLWSWLAGYIKDGQYRRDADDAFSVAALRGAKAELGLAKPFDETVEGVFA